MKLLFRSLWVCFLCWKLDSILHFASTWRLFLQEKLVGVIFLVRMSPECLPGVGGSNLTPQNRQHIIDGSNLSYCSLRFQPSLTKKTSRYIFNFEVRLSHSNGDIKQSLGSKLCECTAKKWKRKCVCVSVCCYCKVWYKAGGIKTH